jgi:hypothetical protein
MFMRDSSCYSGELTLIMVHRLRHRVTQITLVTLGVIRVISNIKNMLTPEGCVEVRKGLEGCRPAGASSHGA